MRSHTLDPYARQMLDHGLDIAVRVRQEDPNTIYRECLQHVSRKDLVSLIVMLAACVDIDRPVAELFEWMQRIAPTTELEAPALRPCGTSAAYARHKRRKEPPCKRCLAAEHAYRARLREEKKAA